MKDTELRLISELMKNSRRSDRELAQAAGVSQPTVSRMIKNFEKEGIIKEYTVIPDFNKLGYELMAITFFKYAKEYNQEELEEVRKVTREFINRSYANVILAERGVGLGYNAVLISFHADYSSYQEFIESITKFPGAAEFAYETFLISLSDKIKYRSLTFSTLAKHVLTLKKK